MSGLIAGLAGAGGAASNAGQYYQNALQQLVSNYGSGSPLASTFTGEERNALQPQWQNQDQALKASLASQGITGSGAAKGANTQLAADQSAQLAGGVAPLFQQALSGATGILSQEPGAQLNAYQGAINNLYSGVSDIGEAAAGLPPSGQGATPYNAGAGADAMYQTPPVYSSDAMNQNVYDAGSYVVPGGG